MSCIPIDFAKNFQDNYFTPLTTPDDRTNYLQDAISNLRDELGKNPRSTNYSTYLDPCSRVKRAVDYLVSREPSAKNLELQLFFSRVAKHFGVIV